MYSVKSANIDGILDILLQSKKFLVIVCKKEKQRWSFYW